MPINTSIKKADRDIISNLKLTELLKRRKKLIKQIDSPDFNADELDAVQMEIIERVNARP